MFRAHISESEAHEAVEELLSEGFVKSVCGLCESQEEVYALTEPGTEFENPTV